MNGIKKGWLVTFAATGINLVLGMLYIWSIMNKNLVSNYNWSSTEASLPYSVCIVVFAFIMIFAGRLQDKKGPQLSALLGGFLLGTGLILSGLVIESPFLMVLTYGVMGGSGIGVCYAATTPPAVKWFPLNKKGLISGIVVGGVGFAAVYISPLTNWLLTLFPLSTTFMILGVGSLVIIWTLSIFLVNPPSDYNPYKSQTSKGTSSGLKQFDWNEMLKTLAFYKYWIIYTFAASAGLMLIGHISPIAVAQANWEKGFYLVVILALGNTGGRVMAGILSDKIGYTRSLQIVLIIQALNMFLFSQFVNTITLGIGTAIAGLGYGALFSIFPAIIADHYGTKNLGVNYGLLFTSFGVAGIIGPLLAGSILDATGAYTLSYILSGVLLLIATLLTLIKTSVNNKIPEQIAKLPQSS
ncbi:OFA family oxalate/formate antiporter-like MFS transporter [Natranaerovirga pectinivora]|uniref:OFA family oxalate/formate antiporter-like MFS transporter n=1 Tax=Natranaerovirga pectinivora TaxID=682400 RepID=A0A4R3MP71_9FIRM|nr:OFA family MFS transporter [Natranaerovirga pectinivora]TCT15389.1 OFA family oxalate/formate antiporter-like MFS transporter [Natranaerovirga pectinivora]